MNLTLQVESRTEALYKEQPAYYLRVKVRGDHLEFAELFTLQVTKEEFDAMSPGNVFKGTIAQFNGAQR